MTTDLPATRIGRSLDDFIAEQEANDPKFAAVRADVAPAVAIANAVVVGRARLQMSQAQLASRMATTNTAISRLESGRQVPTLDTLQKLSDILGLRFMIGPTAVRVTTVDGEGPTPTEIASSVPRLVVAPDPMNSEWMVRHDGGVLQRERTQANAVRYARSALERHGGQLEIRRRNGLLREIVQVQPAAAAAG